MNKIIATAFALVIGAGVVAPAVAGHEDSPGNSQFGKCTALTNGNGANKYEHGKAFRPFDHIDDGDDATDDFTEAYNYCIEYLSNNHPSQNGGGNGNGDGNGRRP